MRIFFVDIPLSLLNLGLGTIVELIMHCKNSIRLPLCLLFAGDKAEG